jgi:hypothetical protein
MVKEIDCWQSVVLLYQIAPVENRPLPSSCKAERPSELETDPGSRTSPRVWVAIKIYINRHLITHAQAMPIWLHHSSAHAVYDGLLVRRMTSSEVGSFACRYAARASLWCRAYISRSMFGQCQGRYRDSLVWSIPCARPLSKLYGGGCGRIVSLGLCGGAPRVHARDLRSVPNAVLNRLGRSKPMTSAEQCFWSCHRAPVRIV